MRAVEVAARPAGSVADLNLFSGVAGATLLTGATIGPFCAGRGLGDADTSDDFAAPAEADGSAVPASIGTRSAVIAHRKNF